MKFLQFTTVFLTIILLFGCSIEQEELTRADEIAIEAIEKTYGESIEGTYKIYTLEYYTDENTEDENKTDYYFHIVYETTNGLVKGLVTADVILFWDGEFTFFNSNSPVGRYEAIYDRYLELVVEGDAVRYSSDKVEFLMEYIDE